MADRDYYNVLGVPRDADGDTIRRAYRRLAMRWHPDRNQGDRVAEVRFRAVAEAYRVLHDPEERARYDVMGPLFQPDRGPPSPEHLRAAVRRAWDDLVGRKDRGEDLTYTLSVSLEEVALGVSREIVVPRRVTCDDCNGLGARPGDRAVCGVCEGTGRGTGLLRARCFHCDGRGYTIAASCPTCGGGGLVDREEALRVKIPAGVEAGARLRVAERGHDAPSGGLPGDLYVLVDVAAHPLFQREGADVRARLPLTVAECILGADVDVPTLQGTTRIRVPAGTPPGHVLRLGGRGLPRPVGARTERGALLLEVVVELPDTLTDTERAALAAWSDALPVDRHPRRAAFDAAVESRR